ncbi:MAG: hypothetical protein M1818_002551 [Claussenomyces sp. TS43310]|nr:MAG: hypothetical protein M1818_002551 [Claussenomyces sp. TS43310]
MRTEIEQLQNHRRQAERVVTALSSNYQVDETIKRLRNGQTLEMVSEWLEWQTSKANSKVTSYASPSHQLAFLDTLKMAESVAFNVAGGSSYALHPNSPPPYDRLSASCQGDQGEEKMDRTSPSLMDGVQDSNITRPLTYGPSYLRIAANDEPSVTSARGMGQDYILGPAYRPLEQSPTERVESWTNVTSNRGLIEHVMALYFCWEYPTFAGLSKEHFMADFRDGRRRFCSPLLVNAMLALGCRFSELPEARLDPSRPETAGDHFFMEAKRLLAEDGLTSLTTIQALGLLSIREASAGRDTESLYYSGQAIRLATEVGLHMEASYKPEEDDPLKEVHEVRSITFWGAFALDEAFNLCVGKIPHLSRAASLVMKPSIIDAVESSEWVPYSDEGAPLTKSASQPSNVRSVFKCFADLSESVQRSLYTLYTPDRILNSNEVLSAYFRYLNWYSSLPESLRLGHNFTPAVLFVHMYYHFAVLMLFRPFIKLRFPGSSVLPRTVCSQSADAIVTLIRSYDQLYTLQHTPSFVPYIVLMSAIIHLVVSEPSSESGAKELMQSVADLQAMVNCHGFAKRCLDILSFLASHWGTGIDLGVSDKDSEEEIAMRCYPNSLSTNMFCPAAEKAVWDMGPQSRLMLFSPFPLQGIPLLATEEDLERHGFQRL